MAANAREEVILAFADALRAQKEDYYPFEAKARDALMNRAFDMAEHHGWNYETDAEFQKWSTKATQQEVLAEGLRRALNAAA